MRHILPFFALSSRGVFAAPWQLPSRTATPAALRIDHLQASATLTSAPALLHRTASPVSIPALTTTFAPLAACLQDIYVYVYTSEQTFTFASLGTSNITACYPPGWRSDSTMHFSPGICPSGYMIAYSSTGQVSDLHETTATCCPSGFSCLSNSQGRRISDISCISNILSITAIVVQKQVTDTFTSSTWTPRPNCDQVNAYGVVILWQSTDHYGIVPPPTTSGQAAARTTSACPTPKNNNGNDSGERLSTSDRVSIGVGLGVGVPSLLLTIWFGWYTRKSYHIKKRKENEAANGIAARSAEWEGLTSKTADIAAVADSPLVEGPPAHSSSVRALPGVDIATLHE